MSTYTGSELATKYAAYLIYKGTATPTQINQITSPKIGYVFDVTESGTLNNGNITVVNGDAVVFLARGWTHMNNAGADEQIAEIAEEVASIQERIEGYDFSTFALKTEVPEIPENVSDFNNDAGYLTQHQSLAAYQTKTESDAAYVGKLSNLNTIAADGTIVQYIGETTSAYRKGYFYIYHTGEGWDNIRVSEGNENGVKHTATLGSGTEGEIVLYTGETTADHITNNFYKYTSGEWEWVDVPGVSFSYNTQTKTIALSYGKTTKEINLNTAIKDNTDDELDGESENPIQNKVVKEALDGVKTTTDKLQADISGLKMQFDANNLQLILMDSEDNVIGTANLAVLAKDAMLEDVEIYTEAETGVSVTPPYLKFTFNTDAVQQPIRVPLSDFVINVTTDSELSPISTNAVQNKVIYEALELIRETINGLTATPDAQLSTTSIKPVQNRILTGEINGIKDRVAALEGQGGSTYAYAKQISDLNNYEGEDGEIVQYKGESTGALVNGFFYKKTKVPDNTQVARITGNGFTGEFNYNFVYQQGKIELDGGDYIIDGLINLYARAYMCLANGVNAYLISVDNTWQVGSLFVNYNSKKIHKIASVSGDTLTDSEGNIFNCVAGSYTNTEQITFNVGRNVNTGEEIWVGGDSSTTLYVLHIKEGTLSTPDAILFYTGQIFTTSSSQEVSYWKQHDIQPVFSGSYNDLSNKPLSVENSKVKYTLSDGTTKLTLAQESELKSVAYSGSYNDLTNKLQNATTSADGLMSATDKSKLDKLTINTINIGATLLCGRTTGSGNYLEIFIPCAFPSNASNVTLSITSMELYFDTARPSLSYDSITTNSVIPLVGASFDLHLTSTYTAYKTVFVLLTGTLTFNR